MSHLYEQIYPGVLDYRIHVPCRMNNYAPSTSMYVRVTYGGLIGAIPHVMLIICSKRFCFLPRDTIQRHKATNYNIVGYS